MDEIVFEPSDVNMLAALGIVESVKLFPLCYQWENFNMLAIQNIVANNS